MSCKNGREGKFRPHLLMYMYLHVCFAAAIQPHHFSTSTVATIHSSLLFCYQHTKGVRMALLEGM